MKNSIKQRLARGLVALAALGTVFGAQACGKYNFACKAREAAERRINDARQAAERAEDEARAAAQQAAQAARAARAEADRQAAIVAAAAQKLATDGAAISASEMKDIAARSQTAYAASNAAAKEGYDRAVAAYKAAYDAFIEALFRSAGKVVVADNRAQLGALQRRMNALDAEGNAALNRIRRAIPSKQITDQTRDDMQVLAAKLGMLAGQADANIPGNVKRSSFGVFVGAGAAYYVGVDESYAIVMNTFMDHGKFAVGITQSVGGSLGPSAGASVSTGVFWAPGSIDDAAGVSVGFSVEGSIEKVGAGTGLSWSVAQGMKGAQNAIPGISLSWNPGAELSAAFNAGYTQLLAKF